MYAYQSLYGTGRQESAEGIMVIRKNLNGGEKANLKLVYAIF